MAEKTPVTNSPVASGPVKRATFFGIHDRDITTNKQAAIPKAFKRVLGATGEDELLAAHFHWENEKFLRLYTKTKLDELIEAVNNDEGYTEAQRAEKIRMIANSAEPVEPDSQGRFVIPARFYDLLGFKDAVVFEGCYTHIWLWPAQAHKEKLAAQQKQPQQPDTRLTTMLSR
ncbi:MAG: division/cell wall cluster transcriptional repressor MraZ [Planctomycetota bacterium]